MKVSALDCRAFIHDSKMFRHADGSMQSFLPTPNPYAEVWTGAMLQLLLMAFADKPIPNACRLHVGDGPG